MKNNKKIIAIFILIALSIGLLVTIKLAGQRQDIRNRAAGSGSTAKLYLSPNPYTFNHNEDKVFDLKADLTGGSTTERMGYFYTEVTFDKNYLNVTINNTLPTAYIDTSMSNFDNKIRISTSSEANNTGIIKIELGALTALKGPAINNNTVTLARIHFFAKQPTVSGTNNSIALLKNQVIDNATNPNELVVQAVPVAYYINSASTTPTLTPTAPVGATNTPTNSPPTNTPPANNPTPTSSVPTATPTLYQQPTVRPTPPSDRSNYLIDIGDKQSLTINIGPGSGTGVQIRFKTKLADVQGHPDLLLRLRVKDELAFLNSSQDTVSNGDSCKNPPSSEKDFWIPVKADVNGLYVPDSSAVPYANANTKTRKRSNGDARATDVVTAPVSADGWVTLDGLYTDKYYSLFLKGPKTKATRTAEHIIWQGGSQSLPEFDWTTDELALQPGDLMDPNSNYEQNCTVNSIDLALIEDRLAKTDTDSLRVADVNYDGVVNGNDVSKVVHTLSAKPDDDH